MSSLTSKCVGYDKVITRSLKPTEASLSLEISDIEIRGILPSWKQKKTKMLIRLFGSTADLHLCFHLNVI